MVTSCGTAESIELSRLVREVVWISCSRTEGVMEVEEEKHRYRNHFIGRNKNANCNPHCYPGASAQSQRAPIAALQVLGRLSKRNAPPHKGSWTKGNFCKSNNQDGLLVGTTDPITKSEVLFAVAGQQVRVPSTELHRFALNPPVRTSTDPSPDSKDYLRRTSPRGFWFLIG